MGLAVLGSLLGMAVTLLTGRVVGAVPGVIDGRADAMSLEEFSWLLGGLLAVFVIDSLTPALQQVASLTMDAGMVRAIGTGITEPLLRPRRVQHLEDAEVLDVQERAKGKGGFHLAQGMSQLPYLLASRITLIGSAVIVGAMFAWWVAAMLVAMTLILEWYGGRLVEREIDTWWGNTEEQRRASYLFNLGMRDAPKELRVFGLHNWLVERYVSDWTAGYRPVWARRRQNVKFSILIGGVHLIANGIAIVAVGRAALNGSLPLTQVATTLPAILAIGQSNNGYGVVQVRRGLSAYRAMRDLPQTIAERHPEPVADLQHRIETMPAREIRFENVSFRYPGSEVDVLRGLDLTLHAHEALALVGINGAGKSTLVKLLGGGYKPTSGRILVDGVDLAELDLAAWQRRVAAIVQDFLRFPLSVTDNVVFGAVERAGDELTLARVARESGIDAVVRGLPKGWDTVLDKTFDGGVDLSGGEWQRVALARALFAVHAGAGVLVLDEPAAALDVRAEAELVERYLELTSGVASLIISHRFSVVRNANRICVLSDGRIVEDGTHEELLAEDGEYAAMFRLQAERYVTGPEAVDA
ncbi:ABC transporter ATP-binding protein [Kribbella pratensis]|uniref:ABC-type multidrug transport system fused ATPase/permease subunit n=1 Tax=Kribbella pratensis TaxID=2512112 RepID=A0A4V3GHU3_9ACTN|nr:ABC transporter ATP-binding protein [Kribbella pratensis]TDW77437.1 ABC-type multidrug transport system fused ATPase/permease subunit [Kribbella pratensis]